MKSIVPPAAVLAHQRRVRSTASARIVAGCAHNAWQGLRVGVEGDEPRELGNCSQRGVHDRSPGGRREGMVDLEDRHPSHGGNLVGACVELGSAYVRTRVPNRGICERPTTTQNRGARNAVANRSAKRWRSTGSVDSNARNSAIYSVILRKLPRYVGKSRVSSPQSCTKPGQPLRWETSAPWRGVCNAA